MILWYPPAHSLGLNGSPVPLCSTTIRSACCRYQCKASAEESVEVNSDWCTLSIWACCSQIEWWSHYGGIYICICVFVSVYLYLCICICLFVPAYLYLCIWAMQCTLSRLRLDSVRKSQWWTNDAGDEGGSFLFPATLLLLILLNINQTKPNQNQANFHLRCLCSQSQCS